MCHGQPCRHHLWLHLLHHLSFKCCVFFPPRLTLPVYSLLCQNCSSLGFLRDLQSIDPMTIMLSLFLRVLSLLFTEILWSTSIIPLLMPSIPLAPLLHHSCVKPHPWLNLILHLLHTSFHAEEHGWRKKIEPWSLASVIHDHMWDLNAAWQSVSNCPRWLFHATSALLKHLSFPPHPDS